jgi:5-methylcytosine-specific restriction protein B
VCSYLLAVAKPQEYAFCKPNAYSAAAIELLGKSARATGAIERIIHCNEFYAKVLSFLEREYELQKGNLFDVHSMFYCFQSKDDGISAWDKLKTEDFKPPKQGELPQDKPLSTVSDNPIYLLLLEKHNVILYGPPGTGKTREALLLANWWRNAFGSETVKQLTFHPSYCYEDFVEGYRPSPNGSGFELREGIFKRICREAKEYAQKKYLLVVDEINRGDVARILGELITLLEGDKRGEKYLAILQQSQEEFFVPENLYLLGTMNTADKSISLMDLAIRRRFLFYYCPPDPDVLREARDFYDSINDCQLAPLLIRLNQRLIGIGVDRDRVLGHSFFLIPKESPDPLEILRYRFKYEIIPLVEEYCYADRSLMGRVLGDLVDSNGLVNSEVLDDNERFIEALQKLNRDE